MNYFRFACEISFCCLLVFYFTIEFIEIVGDIKGKKNEYEKEQKKRQARENRRREMQEMRDLEMDNADFTPGGGLKTPDVAKNAGKNEPVTTFEGLDLRQKQAKNQNKVMVNCCSFVVKGLQEHYKDGWNWIDSAFLILSLVAVALWSQIMADHYPFIAMRDFREMRILD